LSEKKTSSLDAYIISDSSGKTAETVFKAVAVQFDIQELKTHYFTEVTTITQLKDIIKQAREDNNPLIAYTIILPELCDFIEGEACRYDIPAIDILDPFVNKFSRILEREPQLEVGLKYKPGQEVFKRFNCLNFNLRFDKVQEVNKLREADIVLTGVSRTSKTPLSMYLAHQEYRVATVTLSPEVIPPGEIYEISAEKIFGLKIEPRVLQKIRENRVKVMGFSQEVGYVSYDRIVEELKYSRIIMQKLSCRVIDITYKSIEEIAGEILCKQVIKKAYK